MLTKLSVKNLAVVQHLELDLKTGMNVFTGETGAGKSILINALGLTLGTRGSPSMIRKPHKQASIGACFYIKNLPTIQNWLRQQDLIDEHECIIRRVINLEGSSRAYINGHVVPISQLRILGEQLINLHSQHQHYALLSTDTQRNIIDEFAEHKDLINNTQKYFKTWFELQQKINILSKQQTASEKLDLLNYQIQEMADLNLQPKELIKLDQEHKLLAKAEQWLAIVQATIDILKGQTDQDIYTQLHFVINQIAELTKDSQLKSCKDLLSQAIILIEEANQELHDFASNLEPNPNKLNDIEQRLSLLHATARKHRIAPEFLSEHYIALCNERNKLLKSQQELLDLKQQQEKTLKNYNLAAKNLNQSRIKSAKKITPLIIKHLQDLEMPHAKFAVQISNQEQAMPTANGLDNIEFLVSTNPGQPMQSLKKVASGGELSRICLAIQVITAKRLIIPTLIFDEIDAGISGKTAQKIGQLMRKLGETTQLLCITHLPQVASQAHQHYKVTKSQSKTTTQTSIQHLDTSDKTQEIARLLGGIEITPQAVAHARDLLEI